MRNRKNPRLTQFDYRTPGAYFITLVTRQRALRLGEILSGSLHASPFCPLQHAGNRCVCGNAQSSARHYLAASG